MAVVANLSTCSAEEKGGGGRHRKHAARVLHTTLGHSRGRIAEDEDECMHLNSLWVMLVVYCVLYG